MLSGGGGVLSVSLETVLRPLHLHRTVHDKLQEAGGQEVQSEHHSERKKKKKEKLGSKPRSLQWETLAWLFLTPGGEAAQLQPTNISQVTAGHPFKRMRLATVKMFINQKKSGVRKRKRKKDETVSVMYSAIVKMC